jgi:Ca-activated chloride channel family protein
MDIQFGNLPQLIWLWLIPLCVVSGLAAIMAARTARKRFASSNLLDRVVPMTRGWDWAVSTLLYSAAIVLMIVALVDVRWGKVIRDVPQRGIEVIFALDVSRSMLAEDTTPNRLERAKQQIRDVIDEMTGDRVGLVVFAGEARQETPLTSHYEDFLQTLEAVGPESVRRGGSELGTAIHIAADGFLNKTSDHKAIVILTDGEDQESRPVEVARQAFENSGVRIFTIGLGDMDEGARIPVDQPRGRGYLRHNGQQVWSKQNGKILQQIATETDGAYIPAGTKRVNMADVYHGYIAQVPQTEFATAQINSYQARFQWFLVPALLLIVVDVLWSTRRVRNKPETVGAT